MGEYNQFEFDADTNEDAEKALKHHKTNKEIQHLLSDLRLLSKTDFRRLLRWRKVLVKYFDEIKDEKKIQDKNAELQEGVDQEVFGPKEGAEPVLTRQQIMDIEDEKLEADVRELFDEKKKERRKARRKKRQVMCSRNFC